MEKQKTYKKGLILLFLLVFLFSFGNINPSWFWYAALANESDDETLVINEDTTWDKNTPDLVFDKYIEIQNGATLTIEKGTTVTFQKNEALFGSPGIFVENGQLLCNGTSSEHVVITAEESGSFIVDFDNSSNQESLLRYTEISNGGYLRKAVYQIGNFWKNLLGSTAYAEGKNFYRDGWAALKVESGKVRVENSFFQNNVFLDASVWDNGEDPSELKIINSNLSDSEAFFSGVNCGDLYSDNCQERVMLKNNWYGDALGPTEEGDLLEKGVHTYGNYFLDSWKGSDLVVDPVVIIPGILGSTETPLGLKLDPILGIYDNLVASFKENGYIDNKTLFEFPYEWRDSNVLTAEKLKEKIDSIKSITGLSRVDLVAHSMGGLVAREYIEGDNYQDDVEQLITLGTPERGAPKSYMSWEAGEGFFTILEEIGKGVLALESHHAGYSNLKDYIQEKIPTVGELLPDYTYLREASSGKTRDYPTNYPRNRFLENLNKTSNLEKLEKVDFTNIIGQVSSQSTVSKFRVLNSDSSDNWEHGRPENFSDSASDRGIEYGEGDETVPLFSASEIPADKVITLNSSHTDLPTKAECRTIKELTRKDTCTEITTFKKIIHILTFGIFSPIDIQIVSPSGQRVGKDFESGEILNEIEGAYYSGFETENEFLTIPDPEEGEYRILTQGTGAGDYKIEAHKISEDSETGQSSESVASLSGIASPGSREEKSIELENNQILGGDKEETAVASAEATSDDDSENSKSKKHQGTFFLNNPVQVQETTFGPYLASTPHGGEFMEVVVRESEKKKEIGAGEDAVLKLSGIFQKIPLLSFISHPMPIFVLVL